MLYQTTIIEQQLRQIAELLILNGTLVDCPGLVHGKMGIAVCFTIMQNIHTGQRMGLFQGLHRHKNSRYNFEK